MSKTSRIIQSLLGIVLAFLVGIGAMAAQDKVQTAKTGQNQQGQEHASMDMGGMSMTAGKHALAPGLPGWIKHLPQDKQETAQSIWLTDGRSIVGYRELLTAKRHELNAIQALPGTDEKAVAAMVKEVVNTEEKLLTAEIAFRRKLEQEGIPTWGRFDHSMHGMMSEGGEGMMGMEGGKIGMMGMMQGHGASQDHATGDAKKDASAGN